MKSQETREIPFGMRDRLGYMFGDFGNDFTFLLSSMFLMKFYTDVMGVSAALVGAMMMIARIVDAFTDVTMGQICDRSRPGKKGKFTPWLRRMCGPVALASFLMYAVWFKDMPMGFKVFWMFFTYLLWGSICYTGINIPYGSMASGITAEPIERGQLSTFRSVGAALAGVCVNVGVPLFVYAYEGGNQVVLADRFFYIACLFAVLALICYILCYSLSTERVKPQLKETNKGSFARAVKGMIHNRSLLAIIGAAIVLLLSMLLSGSMNTYLYMDYFKSKEAMSLAGFFSTGATLILAPFSTTILKKFGKKEASAFSVLFASIIYFILFFVRIQNPWAFCVMIAFGNLGTGLFNLLIWAFITDVIDYQEVQTGSRDDGTIYAVYSFARKIGQALAGGLGGWVLGAIGYQSSKAGEVIVQTESVTKNIYTVATLAPAVCYLIVGLILLFAYPLSKKVVEENNRILAERRAAEKN